MSDPTADQPPSGTYTSAARVGGEFRSLRRSSSNRVVAGVLGGLGRRLDIDPVVLRVATAVLAVFGGVGVLLYAVAWLLVPADDQPGSVLDQALGRRDTRPGGAIPLSILLTAIILIASGNIVGGSWDGGVLLMLAAVGLVALLYRRSDDAPEVDDAYPGYQPPQFDATMPYWPAPDHPAANSEPSAAAETTTATAGESAPEASTKITTGGASSRAAAMSTPSVSEPVGSEPVGSEPVEPEPVEPPVAGRPPSTTAGHTAGPASAAATAPDASAPPDGTAGSRAVGDSFGSPTSGGPGWPDGPDWGPTAVGWSPPPTPAPPAPIEAAPPPAPRTRSILGPLTVSAALVAVGALAINDVYWASVPAAMYIAVALTVVGLGLLLGTWFGRSRGLIVLGIALCLALVPATFVGRFGPTIRDTTVTVTTPAELPATPVDYGIGDVTYDLAALTVPEGEPASLSVELGTGSLTVIVPRDVDVIVNAATGMGEVTVFEDSAGGFGQERTFTDVGDDGPGGGELHLDLEVGMGEVKVYR